jgi:hypothetical protein
MQLLETTMIEIEKNVPMPNGRCATKEFPYSSMEIGDSFAVIVPPGADVGSFAARARGRAGVWGKKNGAKFSVLLVDEQTKVRVWRVA